jgi:hypothetical protein
LRFGSAAQACPLLLSSIDETSTKERKKEQSRRGDGRDAGQIICHPRPRPRPRSSTVLRVVGLSCHPAEEIPPRKPRALIAARGDATGLPMDRTKSRALCNPPSSASSPTLRSALLTYTPDRRAREGQGAHAPSNLPELCIRREIGRY